MCFSKWIGFGCVFCGCSGLGLWYSVQMKQKIWHLKQMVRILEMVISEIEYGRSTLPECCKTICERAETPYDQIFDQIYKTSYQKTGINFGELCARLLENGLSEISIEEKEVFIRCFSEVGFMDEWIQKRSLERGRDELLHKIDAEEVDLKKRSRMAVSLGTMCGVLLVLILL